MIELPLVVEMSVDTSKKVYQFSIEQTCETYQMTQDAVFNVSVIDTPYEGEYEFTPSSSAQTIFIKNKTATDDIIINPIPNNYGLIGWNGSFLTVS